MFGVPDKKYGETGKAVIEPNPGDERSADSVRQAVAERIASFKKPRPVEALSRADFGEVDGEPVRASYG